MIFVLTLLTPCVPLIGQIEEKPLHQESIEPIHNKQIRRHIAHLDSSSIVFDGIHDIAVNVGEHKSWIGDNLLTHHAKSSPYMNLTCLLCDPRILIYFLKASPTSSKDRAVKAQSTISYA